MSTEAATAPVPTAPSLDRRAATRRHGGDAVPATAGALGGAVGTAGPVPAEVGLDRDRLAAAGFAAGRVDALAVPTASGPITRGGRRGRRPPRSTPPGCATPPRPLRPGVGVARRAGAVARRHRGRWRPRPPPRPRWRASCWPATATTRCAATRPGRRSTSLTLVPSAGPRGGRPAGAERGAVTRLRHDRWPATWPTPPTTT